MNLYRFKTFRTSYYFPSLTEERKFLYGLYTPFGGGLAKKYWKAFCGCSLVRMLTKVSNPDNEFPYSKIMSMMPKDSVVSFNLGTPGPEQKISMLGLESNGMHFFAKYSTKDGAMSLSRNELKVLTELRGMNVAPELYDYKDGGDFVFFRTSCVDGHSPKDIHLNDEIVNLAVSINKIKVIDGDLKKCFCHGDFTPWNLVVTTSGDLRMIDWELADGFELGYDLFVYITQVSGKFNPDMALTDAIEENKNFINTYFASFEIEDWTTYLKAFAKRKIAYENSKGDHDYAQKFECLL